MLLLTFTADSGRYAVAVSQVIEVLPRLELRSIPHAPTFLAGLLSYRGKVVPVIELGVLLGSTPCRSVLSSRIILVKGAPEDHTLRNATPAHPGGGSLPARGEAPALFGMLAENVSDLAHVQPEQISPAPVLLPNAPYLDAIAETGGEIIPLIAVRKIRDHLLCGSFFDDSAVGDAPAIDSKTSTSEHDNRICPT
jgi:chemotaxis-related protein WspB